MRKLITCKNCSNQFEGNFCNMCRQSADTHRITWHEVIHHLPHALFHTDKGLLHTIKEMAVRPGYAIREYIGGKRVIHFNPFLFLILLGGFAIFLFETAHVKLLNKTINLEAVEAYNSLLAHKFLLLPSFIMMLLFVITDYFFYWNKKYVIPELIISNVFQLGQLLAFMILTFPLLFLQHAIEMKYGWHFTMRPVIKAIMVLYLMYVRYQLYEAKAKYWTSVKIVAQVVLIYLIYDLLVAPLIARSFS